MTHSILSILLFCLFYMSLSTDSIAQHHLIFYNDSTAQTVDISPGDIIKLEYRGYLSQPEAIEKRVIQVRQDAVILGQTAFGYADPKTFRTVLLHDITGFRKFSRLRYTLKAAAQIGTAVGSVILFRKVIDRSKLSGTGDILLSLGVGIGSTLLIEALFPKRVKYRTQNGWEYRVY